MVRILFVCTGNICRSPTAEAVLRRHLAETELAGRVEIDSAGIGGWHVGEAPDARATRCAAARGYDLAPLRARRLDARDFRDFDLILAMDRGHLRHLERVRPRGAAARLRLLLEFAADAGQAPGLEVPDPYYGDGAGFERTLDLIEAGAAGLVAALRRNDL